MARRRDNDDDESPKAPINRQTLREAGQLLGYVRPYWLKLSAALLCLTVGSLLGLGFPYLAGNLVDAALLRLSDKTPTVWWQDVNLVALGLIVVLAFQASFAFLRALWFIEVGERSLADLRKDTYGRLIRLSMAFHSARRVGELASRISADLATIRDTLIDGIPHLLREAVLLAGGVALIAITSLRLTGVMLVSVPVLMIVAVLFGNVIRRIAKDIQDRLADSNVIVEETLQNIASVKAFANEPFEESRYRGALDVYLTAALRGAFFEGAFISFIVFALFGSIVLVLWYGARLVLTGEMTAGELTRFMLFTMYVAGAVGSFAELYSQIQRMLGASQRVRELLRKEPEPTGPRSTGGSPVKDTGEPPVLRVLRLRGEVRFDDVHFRYPSRPEVPVLRGVTLTAQAGQRVALVGPSGAGKSTIVSLILRFYEPESGRILIDGQDARSYDLHALRSQMALVPQDVILFGGTIGENIAYGRPGASQYDIAQAARKANAHDFIVTFPDGYQTRVGERGVQLSGGQRQRVAIARAILRDPAILLLDEATSSLDSESESLVLQALDRLMEGRTAIVIAHRLSTVRGADRIFVVKDGSVIEEGNHSELMDRPDGLYRNLSLLQLNGSVTPSRPSEDSQWPTSPLPPTPVPPRS
jgi:ABC-type multidrug transport system fused ATPase/permease subunit